jgi:hypothetical protein
MAKTKRSLADLLARMAKAAELQSKVENANHKDWRKLNSLVFETLWMYHSSEWLSLSFEFGGANPWNNDFQVIVIKCGTLSLRIPAYILKKDRKLLTRIMKIMNTIQIAKIVTIDGNTGALLTPQGVKVEFSLANARVLLKDRGVFKWIPAPTPAPQTGQEVVFEIVDGVVFFSHIYDGLINLLNAEPIDGFPVYGAGWQLYLTKAGTLVLPAPPTYFGSTTHNNVGFECTPEEYQAMLDFVPPAHPQQWQKLGDSKLFRQYNGWKRDWVDYPEGQLCYELNMLSMTHQNCGEIKIHRREDKSLRMQIEHVMVKFHHDGTVSVEGWHGQPQTELTIALLQNFGLEVVENARPVTEKGAIDQHRHEFFKAHKPSPEREAEILAEVRERFGWGVYPPVTPMVKTLVAPVGYIFSDFAEDFGKSARQQIKFALIGIYDPAAVEEWEKAVEEGLILRLDSSAWGPATSASAYEGKMPAHFRDGHKRITNRGHVIDFKQRWELLSWGGTEAEMADLRARFERVDAGSLTGAIMLIGLGEGDNGTNLVG